MSGSPGADELHLSEEEEESLLGQLWDMLGASDDVGSSGAGTAGRGSFAPGLTLTSPDGSGGPIDTSGMGPLEFGQAFIAAVRTGAGRGRGRRPLMRVDCCLRLVGRCAGWGRVHHNLRSCRSCSSPNSPNQCLVLFQWWPHLLGTLTPARRALLARATATSSPTPQPLLPSPPPPLPFQVDWTEPWLMALLAFHVVCFVLVIVTRRRTGAQIALFLVLGWFVSAGFLSPFWLYPSPILFYSHPAALVLGAQTLNELAAQNWRYGGIPWEQGALVERLRLTPKVHPTCPSSPPADLQRSSILTRRACSRPLYFASLF